MSVPESPNGRAAVPRIGLVVGILALASSTSIMSTDMYSPSLPDLAKWFDTTPSNVKLTISLNMLAFGLAQLLHGPLSDRFGRRPVILCSLVSVAILCVGCALAQTIEQLIAMRILLGIAAAAEAVVGLAILKDLYDEQQQVKALALLGMVIAVTPAVAPIAGGYLHVAFGWQSNFYVISAMALLSAGIVAAMLPESAVIDKQGLRARRVLQGYGRLLANGDFLVHSSMLGVGMGLIFVFVTGAPFVLIDYLGVPIDHFGYYQASIVAAFFFGSVLASRLADHWPGGRLLHFGVAVITIGAIALTIVVLTDVLSPWRFAGAYSIMTFGMGPLFAVAPSRALRSIKGQAGIAAALLTGIEQITAGLAALAISLANDGTARPLVWVTLVMLCLLLLQLKVSRQWSSA